MVRVASTDADTIIHNRTSAPDELVSLHGMNVANVMDGPYAAVGDGVHDDSVGIQSTLDGRGIVFFPPNKTYRITTQLDIHSDTIVYGYGAKILQDASATADYTCFDCDTASDVTILGIEIDGNRSDKSSVSSVNYGYGVRCDTVARPTVRDCYIHDCFKHGVAMYTCTEPIVEGNRIADCGQLQWGVGSGVWFLDNSYDFIIANNVVSGCNNHAICVDDWSGSSAPGHENERFTITGNIITVPSQRSVNTETEVDIWARGIMVQNCRYGAISGNLIKNGYAGIELDIATTDTSDAGDCSITGNTILECSLGVFLNNVQDTIVSGNHIEAGNGSDPELSDTPYGVLVETALGTGYGTYGSRNITVANNLVFSTYRGIGVYLYGSGGAITHAVVKGNTVAPLADLSGEGLANGIWIEGATKATVAENYIHDYYCGIRTDSTALDTIIIGNQCVENVYGLYLTGDGHEVMGNYTGGNTTLGASVSGAALAADTVIHDNRFSDGWYLAGSGPLDWANHDSSGTAAPTSGTWYRGDKVYNTIPAPSGYEGWLCTTAGKAHPTCTGDTHTNTTLDNVNPTTAFANGDTIKGTGIPAGTTVLSGGGTASITLSQAATGTASGVALYDAVFKAFGAISA